MIGVKAAHLRVDARVDDLQARGNGPRHLIRLHTVTIAGITCYVNHKSIQEV